MKNKLWPPRLLSCVPIAAIGDGGKLSDMRARTHPRPSTNRAGVPPIAARFSTKSVAPPLSPLLSSTLTDRGHAHSGATRRRRDAGARRRSARGAQQGAGEGDHSEGRAEWGVVGRERAENGHLLRPRPAAPRRQVDYYSTETLDFYKSHKKTQSLSA